MKQIFFIICLVIGCQSVQAQDPRVQQIIEDILESRGSDLSEDADIQEIIDDLEKLIREPLAVNYASPEDFLQLHILSEIQISELMIYRQKTGTLYTIYEMAAIEGFSAELLQKIEPFLSFESEKNLKTIKKGSGEVFLRGSRTFSGPSDPNSTKYEGTPDKYYLRMKGKSENISYGLVAEKDPGEAIFRKSNKQGFDYTGAYFNVRLKKQENIIYVGDYHVQFGQGLVASQGFSMGKASEPSRIFKSAQGIKSYSSTDENLFFRGLAAQFKYRNLSFYPFVALNKLDANVDTLLGTASFGAFQSSGYHRTGSELTGENALKQFAGGGYVSLKCNRWSFGITSMFNRFDVRMQRSDEPYNRFLPNGKEHVAGSFDWKGTVQNIFLFGEAAISPNTGRAFLSGAIFKPASNVEMALIYRNINKTYFSYFSNTFTESSKTNDEHGFYMGVKVFPFPGWVIWGYADFYRYQWLKYLTAAPANGAEVFAQLSYNPSKRTSIYLRYFQEEKDQKVSTESLKYNESQTLERIRLNFTHEMNRKFRLNSRVEFSSYSKLTSERGILIFQDCRYSPDKADISMNARLEYFSTGGYSSRIYAYENDLLYSFSIPALFGKGVRGYFNLEKKFGQRFGFWIKLAAVRKFAQKTDNEVIEPGSKFEVKMQIRYRF